MSTFFACGCAKEIFAPDKMVKIMWIFESWMLNCENIRKWKNDEPNIENVKYGVGQQYYLNQFLKTWFTYGGLSLPKKTKIKDVNWQRKPKFKVLNAVY